MKNKKVKSTTKVEDKNEVVSEESKLKKVATKDNVNVIINLIDSLLKLLKLRKKQGGKLKSEQVTGFTALVIASYAAVVGSISDTPVDYSNVNQLDAKFDSMYVVNNNKLDSLGSVINELKQTEVELDSIQEFMKVKGNNLVIGK
jgi:hypothetical protein